MWNSFNKTQFCYIVRTFLLLTFLFCLRFYVLGAKAQESVDGKILSKKPLISQIFYPAKNETEVKVILASNADASNPRMMSNSQITFPIQSGVNLGFATYVYEGRIPGGKQNVRFTFVSDRKDTFEDQPAFSINADDQEIQKGVAELPGLWDKNQQMITLNVPTEAFLRVAAAKKVEFRLGPKTYKPVGFQLKYMRALAKIIDPRSK